MTLFIVIFYMSQPYKNFSYHTAKANINIQTMILVTDVIILIAAEVQTFPVKTSLSVTGYIFRNQLQLTLPKHQFN